MCIDIVLVDGVCNAKIYTIPACHAICKHPYGRHTTLFAHAGLVDGLRSVLSAVRVGPRSPMHDAVPSAQAGPERRPVAVGSRAKRAPLQLGFDAGDQLRDSQPALAMERERAIHDVRLRLAQREPVRSWPDSSDAELGSGLVMLLLFLILDKQLVLGLNESLMLLCDFAGLCMIMKSLLTSPVSTRPQGGNIDWLLGVAVFSTLRTMAMPSFCQSSRRP